MTAKLPEEEIFHLAREILSGDERLEFVAQRCGADESLRDRIIAMLDVHLHEQEYLEDAKDPDMTTGGHEASPMQDQDVESPGDSIGPFKIREQIGEGGMGVVYVAEQSEPVARKVALKVIKPGMDSKQVVARFEAERQALAMMDHPNIARVLDAGTTESGRPYFAMDLVRGLPITKYCEKHRLDMTQRLRLLVDVCHAVQHAHQKGIIHRDLKPSNVLVTRMGDRAIPKVIDFGLAKAMGPQLTDHSIYTQLHQLIGTPLYMSPEQAEMSAYDVDTRSDVYSLGVVLYELLTRETPIQRDRLSSASYDEIRRIVREEVPKRPSERVTTVAIAEDPTQEGQRLSELSKIKQKLRGELDWITLKSLEKDAERRYQSASDFADDLQRYLDGDAVEACPPSFSYRLRKAARKHRTIVVTSALLATTLLVATGISLLFARQASLASIQAGQEAIKADLAANKAEENFDFAIDTIDRLLVRVAGEKMREDAASIETAEEIAEDAAEFFASLIEQNPSDARLRLLHAKATILQGELGRDRNRGGRQKIFQGISALEKIVGASANPKEVASEIARASLLPAKLMEIPHISKDFVNGDAQFDRVDRALEMVDQYGLEHSNIQQHRQIAADVLLRASYSEPAESAIDLLQRARACLLGSEPDSGETTAVDLELGTRLLSQNPSAPNASLLLKAGLSYWNPFDKQRTADGRTRFNRFDAPVHLGYRRERFRALINLGRATTLMIEQDPMQARPFFDTYLTIASKLLHDYPNIDKFLIYHRAFLNQMMLRLVADQHFGIAREWISLFSDSVPKFNVIANQILVAVAEDNTSQARELYMEAFREKDLPIDIAGYLGGDVVLFAHAWLDPDELQEAASVVRAAAEFSNGWEYLYSAYGGLLFRLGKYRECIEIMTSEKVVFGYGSERIFRDPILSMAHYELGNFDKALQYKRKAIQRLNAMKDKLGPRTAAFFDEFESAVPDENGALSSKD